MKNYSEGDRVTHEYLGAATIIECHKDAMDSKRNAAYTIRPDKTPDVKYNMGHRDCLVFPGALSPNDGGNPRERSAAK